MLVEENKEKEVLFTDLSGDSYQAPQEIESLCVHCQKNGTTTLLLTRIPHYKEVILMSFNCKECGFSNNEIQSGSMIQEKGIRIEIKIKNSRDLSRQVVKSDYATVTVPDIDLTIPALTQKGDITTVEGIISRTKAGLEQEQPVRKYMDPEAYEKIEEYTSKIQALLDNEKEWSLILEDPSGNSFIENPLAPAKDPGRKEKKFERNTEQNHQLGLYSAEELKTEEDLEEEKAKEQSEPLTGKMLEEEVLVFDTACNVCGSPAQTNMKITNIPFFKEVVIMATVCEYCGNRTNEVKAGGGIEPMGKKIILKFCDPTDLTRDVLKSETCSICIPELEFEMGGGALGGRFTTVEGLLKSVMEEIEKNSVWGAGDATAPDVQERMSVFKEKLHDLTEGKEEFTLILDDPAGNSFLQNIYAPEEDPNMTIEEYTRSYEQDDDLGLNDMKTENYQQDQPDDSQPA